MLFVPVEMDGNSGQGSVAVACGTDNRGNSMMVDKWMTTKYPLCNVLMELTEQLFARQLALRLGWTPREANQPADDLTNGRFERFSASHRVSVQWADLDFKILPDLMKEGAG